MTKHDMDGIYSFVFSNSRGVGIGFFAVEDGIVSGTDMWGVRYTGSIMFEAKTATVLFRIESTIPPDAKHDMCATLKIYESVPADFANGKPITVEQGHGNATIMIKRASDECADYAKGFTLICPG